MSRRADQITANEPDLVSRARNGYGGIGDQAVSFIAQGDLENTQIAFSTSLRQVMNARERTKVERRADLGSLMALGAQPLAKPMVTAGFDVWAQGRLAQIEHEASESDLGLLYFGADYKFASGLLVGILAQLDWTDEKDATNNNKIDGHGFLVGPYVVGRVHQNVLFDGRIAWGTSDNGISPIGTYEDSFETSRWLIKAQLTGDIRYGSLNLAPHVGVIYFEEDQDSYTDSLNTFIPEQTIKLGRLTLGPKFSTSIQNGSGTLSPYVVLKGIWDFEREDIINVTTGFAEGTDDFRGRVEGGLTMTGSDGITLTGEGFYDGIGASGFDAYGGSAELSVKLN